tara:strand:- start:312 stop:578 length:267 start_codon:yes stop_codon:yes gene_type:complete
VSVIEPSKSRDEKLSIGVETPTGFNKSLIQKNEQIKSCDALASIESFLQQRFLPSILTTPFPTGIHGQSDLCALLLTIYRKQMIPRLM